MAAAGRLLARLLDGLFVLTAAVLLLAALYVSLGRALVPLVAEYRSELESRASAALGQPLRVGALEGRWQGLAPLLLLRDVQLELDGEALHLDQLRLVPDVFASLRSRSLRIARLELQGLQLGLQEDAEGRWRLKGLRPADPAAPPLDPARLLGLLLAPRQVLVQDSRLSLETRTGEVFALNYLGLTLDNGRAEQRLDGRLLLPDGQPLSWQLQTRLQAEAWREASAQLYLSLPQSDWAPWLAQRLPADWQLPRLQAGGEVWLDWATGQAQRAVARLHAPRLTLVHAPQAPAEFADLALTAHFQRETQGWRLLVEELAGSFAEERLNPGQLQLRQHAGEQPYWSLQAEHLNLAPLAALTRALAPLPPQAAEILASLAPHGRLRDLNAEIRPRDAGMPEVEYNLRLDQVGISAWHGVPALANVSGSLSGSLEGGELRLDAHDFMLHLDTLFPAPWRYRTARARLNWSLDHDAFTLSSTLMRLSGEEGELAGNMLIRLRRDPAAEDYMDLQVGLHQGLARYTERYLPTRSPGLSPQLAAWLKSAIRGGQIKQGMFVYQGSLNKGAPAQARALGLYFQVHDAELAYQADWPPLRQLEGEVFVEDSGVRVRAPSARVLDSRLQDVQAQVKLNGGKRVPVLEVDGQVRSSLGDGLKILQDTPLGRSQTFAGWQGEGPLDGRLQLDIPLARAGGEVRAVVDFATEGARLQLPQPALELQQLKGAFRYDTDRGLSAAEIRGRAFERPLRGVIRAQGQAGKPLTQLDIRGSIAVERLASWLGVQPAQVPASGELPYRLWLDLQGDSSRLRVSSDLQGTRIDLPAPLGKPAEEARSANWRMTLSGDERRYSLSYAGLANLNFAAPPGQLAAGRGELRFGGAAAQLPRELGLHIRGQLGEFDWPAWQAAQARYADPSQREGLGGLLQSLALRVDRFSVGSLSLEQLRVDLRRTGQSWRLQLDNPQLRGSAVLPQDRAAPLRIELERLRLPPRESELAKAQREAAGIAASDPLAEVDPRSLPAMDVSIDALYLGEERLGRWQFRSRPSANGARFDQLDLDLQGLRLDGSLDWQGVGLDSRSHYRGRLAGKDLADVLMAWGYTPSITSRGFEVEVDGNWPGSPAMAGLKHFSGSLAVQARQGQLLEVEGSATALRVFGLLNFNSIGRRLRLDFSDLLGKGLSYDRIDGHLVGTDGVLLTRGPLVLDGPSTRLELDGQLDMAHDRIAAKLRVTLPLSNNLPLAALLAGAAPVAGALFIVDQLVGDRLSRVASVEYRVAGPWQDPQISLFGKPSGGAR
ncbi:TIGR02099 family protein [Pseudomonas linyingensis]|uniref:TIGR02099 family protein n=1 Tax=Pseudomonas linyingensis TaxID=915471 RepID=A0A1H6S971_9PSED|nr:YhdP family protein [Pseudomonas linyingensis]SEI63346.1 TIGR02099 family protein [Pseudomonas linyingensis]